MGGGGETSPRGAGKQLRPPARSPGPWAAPHADGSFLLPLSWLGRTVETEAHRKSGAERDKLHHSVKQKLSQKETGSRSYAGREWTVTRKPAWPGPMDIPVASDGRVGSTLRAVGVPGPSMGALAWEGRGALPCSGPSSPEGSPPPRNQSQERGLCGPGTLWVAESAPQSREASTRGRKGWEAGGRPSGPRQGTSGAGKCWPKGPCFEE